MRRQGATSKGLLRRLGDLQFKTVEDRRVAGKVAYSMELILRTLVFGIVTAIKGFWSQYNDNDNAMRSL